MKYLLFLPISSLPHGPPTLSDKPANAPRNPLQNTLRYATDPKSKSRPNNNTTAQHILAMPFDFYSQEDRNPTASDDEALLRDLRLALIGNNDLKVKLLLDGAFPSWLDAQLRRGFDNLQNSGPPHVGREISDYQTSLTKFHERILVLRLLETHESASKASVSSLQACVPSLIAFLAHLNQECFSQSAKIAGSTWDILFPVYYDTLLAVKAFANATVHSFSSKDFDVLWDTLACCILLADNCPFSLDPAILRAVELVPILLDQGMTRQSEQRGAEVFAAAGRLLSNHISIRKLYLFLHTETASFSSCVSRQNNDGGEISPLISALIVLLAQYLNYLNQHESDAAMLQVRNLPQLFLADDSLRCLLHLTLSDESSLFCISTLNLLQFSLKALRDEPESSISAFAFVEALYPRLVELLDSEDSLANKVPKYLQFPIAILCDLCLDYPALCKLLRNTNVDFRIMSEYAKKLKHSSLFSKLLALKLSCVQEKKVADFTVLRKKHSGDLDFLDIESTDLELFSKFLLLLGVFTSSSEEFRRRITAFAPEPNGKSSPNFLCLLIFEMVENYDFLTLQVIYNMEIYQRLQATQSSKKLMTWLNSNIGVLLTLVEHKLFSNTFFLMRSLSRSVSTLRTFFVDCSSIRSYVEIPEEAKASFTEPKVSATSFVDIMEARYDRDVSFDKTGNLVSCLLNILNKMERVTLVASRLSSVRRKSSQDYALQTRKEMCDICVTLLATIANLILDFSSFRYDILNHENFLSDLARLMVGSMSTKQDSEKKGLHLQENRDIAFEQLRIQIGILQVIKNYLYNENEENRKHIWQHIALSLIFERSLYGVSTRCEEYEELHDLQLQQKVIAFEIMRNVTAASSYFSEAIVDLYAEYAHLQPSEARPIPVWSDYLLENLLSYDLFVDTEEFMVDDGLSIFDNDEYLLRLIANTQYVRLVVAINYLEDHRFTNISAFKESDFPHRRLLDVWKRLLSLNLTKVLEKKICGEDVNAAVKLSNQLSEIKVSISWILINLTWRDEGPGYQMPAKSSFHLLDTVLPATGEGAANLFSLLNIVIEESDESENETDAESRQFEVFSLEARAKLLYKHGFSKVLQKLIYDMSAPFRPGNGSRTMERFDHLNSNDLYEKSKTAHYQIISLVSKHAGEGMKTSRAVNLGGEIETHPMRRASNIVSARDSRIIREAAQTRRNLGDRVDSNEHESEDADLGAQSDIDDYWIR